MIFGSACFFYSFIEYIGPSTCAHCWVCSSYYSLRFKMKVTYGHKLCYEIKGAFGEIYVKLHQTNWNVARNNVNVVANELPRQIIHYTCLTIDIWTRWCQHTSTRFYALRCHLPKMVGF